MMTNQVNQEFEKWFESQYNHKPKENNGVYMTMFADGASKGYQAATKSSESEINSLKQRVDELQADNLRLRDALEANRTCTVHAICAVFVRLKVRIKSMVRIKYMHLNTIHALSEWRIITKI